jgi:hypothetical protein
VLNYLYWQEDEWARIMWHNFYEQEKNIDYVYIGSSHVYCDLNPEILDEKNGKNNFNMSTSSQRLIESYYLLREVDRKHKVEKVYLELYYSLSTGINGDYRQKITVQNGWRGMNFMKGSFYKTEALLSMNPAQYYPEAFFPFIRYREHLMDGNWIKERADYKNTENYKKFIYNDGTTEYKDKGYLYTTRELSDLFTRRDREPEEMYLTDDAEEYLRKIIEYCQKKKVQITLFSSPIYETQLMANENYDQYVDDVKKIASEYGIAYYDFNMAKEEYLPIWYPEYFRDVGHLNARGAELYTNFFHQVVSGTPEDNVEYFYDTYREKLEYSKPNVYGVYCYNLDEPEFQEDGELKKMQRMVIASNTERKLEYRVLLTPDEGKTVLQQDFSVNKEFDISAQENGLCEVIWRDAESGGKGGRIEVRY